MLKARLLRLVIFTLAALLIMLPAYAHEGREIAETYEIFFGWREEPAYAGLMNGPEVSIAMHDGSEFPADTAVALQAEVSFGDQTTTLTFDEAFGEVGHYIADLIPTLPGDYSFRLTGTIGDAAVDEVFSSADGEFSSVEPASDIMFPVIPTVDERIAALEARIAALEEQLAAMATPAP
jgi:hypothetical protein